MVEYTTSAELDRVFSALADPTRRAILRALTRHPATINEIAKPFPVSLNAISKHVMVLERAGLLRREIKGRQHHCRIEPGPLRQADAWMAHYRQFWDDRLDALAVYVDKNFKAAKKGTPNGNLRWWEASDRSPPQNAGPREFVYQAWIDPEGMREWMCPGDVVSAEAVLDVRVGGSFRVIMKSNNQVHEHTGIYQIVEPPAKLAFTWSTVESPAEITLFPVEFIPHGDESELVITHERFTNPDLAQWYETGWGTIAKKFAAYLAEGCNQERVRRHA